jgi:DNA-binding NarL/FixJ family response regulator
MLGGRYLTPLISKGEPLAAFLQRTAQAPPRKLTARQREVLQLLAEGRLMKEVADVLDVTPRTVAFHKYTVMQQLGVKTNAELIQQAVKLGLVRL